MIAQLRERYPHRRQLLRWAYNDNWRAIEANYVRLPSLAKRRLVCQLVAAMKPRVPWFKSKTLHAFAFRAKCFQKARPKTRYLWTDHWSSLYKRVEIQRRPGSPRVLYVPVPPLRLLQREILDRCLKAPLSLLTPNVMGCRPPHRYTQQTYGIYKNAYLHFGQEFVASFDIENFFPSVQVGEIIATLGRLETEMLWDMSKDGELNFFPWTQDSAVLVGRLVTRFADCPREHQHPPR